LNDLTSGEFVYEYDYDYFLKCFFNLKYIKIIIFFIFKKSFLKSAFQNDPIYIKKLNFSKKNLNYLETRVDSRSQKLTESFTYSILLH
jgi:hypothetical protein